MPTTLSIELTCLLFSALLGFLHIVAQVMTQRLESPHIPYDPNRETEPALGPKAARAARALKNFLETYPLFIALIAVVTLSGTTGTLTAWGAMLYLGARTVYLPLYILGIAPLRSLIWTLGFVGLALIFAGALA